jgi:hypothetical protein
MRLVRSVAFLAFVLAAVMRCEGDPVTNWLDRVPYSYGSHFVCNRPPFDGLELALDPISTTGWSVVSHHPKGWGYVARVTDMPAVSYLDFRDQSSTVDFPDTHDFYVVFCRNGDGQLGGLEAYNGWAHFKVVDGTVDVVMSVMETDPGARVILPDEAFTGSVPPDDDPPEEPACLFAWELGRDGVSARLVRPCIAQDAEGRLEIPSEINGLAVVEICDYAFERCTNITEVEIPESVTRLGYRAFWKCTKLVSAQVPRALRFEDGTFPEGCKVRGSDPWRAQNGPFPEPEGLVLELPEASWNVRVYDDHVELDKNCLPIDPGDAAAVRIPEQIQDLPVTSIGDDAFYGHVNLTGVVIPNTISNIGYKAFASAATLKSLMIPDSMTNVEFGAICAIRTLESLVIGAGVRSIGLTAFAWNTSLTNLVIKDGVREIPAKAFLGCESLASVCIPTSVERIESAAFDGCRGLKEAILPIYTQIESDSFPPGCAIVRIGPRMLLQGKELGACDNRNSLILPLVNPTDWRTALSVNAVVETEDQSGDPSLDDDVLQAVVLSGISASRSVQRNDGTLDVYFAKPKVKFTDFSISGGKVKVCVEPQGGSRIVKCIDAGKVVRIIAGLELSDLAGELPPSFCGHEADTSDYLAKGDLVLDMAPLLDLGYRFFSLQLSSK